eukprot:c10033_g1_i1.p1 GENE.c10033_g1_i1~~c10033_g1_i1.p1  ORF type:complete len:286 (+),score=97.52 c10033_g1_i1:1-858(+)
MGTTTQQQTPFRVPPLCEILYLNYAKDSKKTIYFLRLKRQRSILLRNSKKKEMSTTQTSTIPTTATAIAIATATTTSFMHDPVFAATRVAHFVDALCSSCNNNSSSDKSASVFRCIEPASISLYDYAVRLGTYMRCSASSFVVGAVLVHRLYDLFPQYFCNLSALKILLTACVLGTKFVEDAFYTNSFYAICGGVTLEEINCMESAFLSCIDFRVFVSPEQFVIAEHRLNNICVLLAAATAHPQKQQQIVEVPQQQQQVQQPSRGIRKPKRSAPEMSTPTSPCQP